MATVTFVKNGKKVKDAEVAEGTNLRRAAFANGIGIHHDLVMPESLVQYLNCQGFGMCATCYVFVKKGQENLSPPGTWERARLGVSLCAIGHEQEIRLSCQTTVLGDCEVEIHPNNLAGERFWEQKSSAKA